MIHFYGSEPIRTGSKIYGVFMTRMEMETMMDQLKSYDIDRAFVSILIPCLEDELPWVSPHSSAVTLATSLKLGGSLEELSNVTLYQNDKVGHFLVAGPLADRVALGLKSQDTLEEFLLFCGFPEHEVSHYVDCLKEKGLVMGLETNDHYQLHQTRSLLKSNGARHVCTASTMLNRSSPSSENLHP